MKKKIFVAREVFQEVLDFLAPHFEVQANQEDKVLTAEELAGVLADKEGAMTTLTERIDENLLSRCSRLKAVCNIAVGVNNIDLAACSTHGVMASNTPGVLDDTTADFAWALILATARRLNEAEAYVRAGQWDEMETETISRAGCAPCRAGDHRPGTDRSGRRPPRHGLRNGGALP